MKFLLAAAAASLALVAAFRRFRIRRKTAASIRPYWNWHIPVAGFLIALAAVMFSLNTGNKPAPRRIFFLLDCSASMLAPWGNTTRLEAAKSAAANTAKTCRGDELCLLTFAGNAFVDFPPSSDTDAFLKALNACAPGSLNGIGSSPAAALRQADMLAGSGENLVFLFTDCEINSPNPPLERKVWTDRTIPVFVICCGEPGKAAQVPGIINSEIPALSVPDPASLEELCGLSSAAFSFPSLDKIIDYGRTSTVNSDLPVIAGIFMLLAALWLDPLAKWRGKNTILILLAVISLNADEQNLRVKLADKSLKPQEKAVLLSNLAYYILNNQTSDLKEAETACKDALRLSPGLNGAAVNLECVQNALKNLPPASSQHTKSTGKTKSAETNASGKTPGTADSTAEIELNDKSRQPTGNWRDLLSPSADRNKTPAPPKVNPW